MIAMLRISSEDANNDIYTQFLMNYTTVQKS